MSTVFQDLILKIFTSCKYIYFLQEILQDIYFLNEILQDIRILLVRNPVRYSTSCEKFFASYNVFTSCRTCILIRYFCCNNPCKIDNLTITTQIGMQFKLFLYLLNISRNILQLVYSTYMSLVIYFENFGGKFGE